VLSKRRLRALKLLSRKGTRVTVVDLESITRGEFAEDAYCRTHH
jgi:hypothetical protein